MRIFAENELRDYLQSRLRMMDAKIEGEADNYLLNVSAHQYVAHLVESFTVEPLEFCFEHAYVTTAEAMIPAEQQGMETR